MSETRYPITEITEAWLYEAGKLKLEFPDCKYYVKRKGRWVEAQFMPRAELAYELDRLETRAKRFANV